MAASAPVALNVASVNGTTSSGGGAHTAQVDEGLPFVLFVLAMGAFLRTVMRAMPRHWHQPPYTVTVMLVATGFASLKGQLGTLGRSIEFWEKVHPHVILFVLLPPLIYEDSSTIDFHVFRRVLRSSLLLAFVGVAMGVAILTPPIHVLLAGDEWTWWTSAMLAAILSATDPVAVVAVLRDLGAPARLSTLISGESLLNDGSAFVLFLIFKVRLPIPCLPALRPPHSAPDPARRQDFVTGVARSGPGVVGFFLQLSVGGALFGFGMALLLYFWLKLVFNDSFIQNTLTLTAAFAVFFTAESSLHVSGLLATVVLGLWMAYRGKFALGHEVEHENHAIVSNVAFAANTMIFALSGVVTFHRIADLDAGVIGPRDWLVMAGIFVAMVATRAVVVASLFPLLTRMGYGLTWREAAIVVYGGLRGAVGVALALLVEEDERVPRTTRTRVAFHVAGVVSLSLLLNGTTTGWVYRRLQPYPPNRYRRRMLKQAMGLLQHHLEEFVGLLCQDWFFRDSQWDLVRELVPELRDVDPDTSASSQSLSLTRMTRTLARFVDLALAGDNVHRSRTMRELQRGAMKDAAALRDMDQRMSTAAGSEAGSRPSRPPSGSADLVAASGAYDPGADGPPSHTTSHSSFDLAAEGYATTVEPHDTDLSPVAESAGESRDAAPQGQWAPSGPPLTTAGSGQISGGEDGGGRASGGGSKVSSDLEAGGGTTRRFHVTQRARRSVLPFSARMRRNQEQARAVQAAGPQAPAAAMQGLRRHLSVALERVGDDPSLDTDEDEDEDEGSSGLGLEPPVESVGEEAGERTGAQEQQGRRASAAGQREADPLSRLARAARMAARARRGTVGPVPGGGGARSSSPSQSGMQTRRPSALCGRGSELQSMRGISALVPQVMHQARAGQQGPGRRSRAGSGEVAQRMSPPLDVSVSGPDEGPGAGAAEARSLHSTAQLSSFPRANVVQMLMARTQEEEEEEGQRRRNSSSSSAQQGSSRRWRFLRRRLSGEHEPVTPSGAEMEAVAKEEEEEEDGGAVRASEAAMARAPRVEGDESSEGSAEVGGRGMARRRSVLAAYGSAMNLEVTPETLVALDHDRQLLLYNTLLNALRAKFHHMFEMREIGPEAMLRLTEAVDLGTEAVGSYRCPLVEALEYVEDTAEPPEWMLRLDQMRVVQNGAHFLLYDHLEASVEAWRALILATTEIREDPELAPALSKDTRAARAQRTLGPSILLLTHSPLSPPRTVASCAAAPLCGGPGRYAQLLPRRGARGVQPAGSEAGPAAQARARAAAVRAGRAGRGRADGAGDRGGRDPVQDPGPCPAPLHVRAHPGAACEGGVVGEGPRGLGARPAMEGGRGKTVRPQTLGAVILPSLSPPACGAARSGVWRPFPGPLDCDDHGAGAPAVPVFVEVDALPRAEVEAATRHWGEAARVSPAARRRELRCGRGVPGRVTLEPMRLALTWAGMSSGPSQVWR